MKRFIEACVSCVLACSNGTTTPDGGSVDASMDVVVDGYVDAGAEADAGLSVPAALDQAGKVALWLEASSTNIVLGDAGVATWKDSSQWKNDAVMSVASPVVDPAVIAGHDAVRFNVAEAALAIADSASLRFGTDALHIVVVTRAADIRCFWWDKDFVNDAGADIGIQAFSFPGTPPDGGMTHGAIAWTNNTSGNVSWPALADATFHIVSFRRTSPTTITLAVDDGTPVSSTVAADDISATGVAAYIGSHNGGPSVRDLSIAEELILHDSTGTVADADVAALHAYLKQKYAL